jgi:predicted alpha/beta hydrolase family esterase
MKKIKYFILTKSFGCYINLLSFLNPKKATQLAYQLFSEPRAGKLQLDVLPELLQEAEKETLTYQSHEFQTYSWKGNHQIILLVHGWESNASRWEKLLPYLKKTGKTIVALDAPAHGLTSGKEFNVPLYTACIEVAVRKFKPETLIGHSIGGAACIYFQHRFQNENLSKIVLLGAPSDMQILISNYLKLLSLNSKMELLLENYFITNFNFKLADFSGKLFAENIAIPALIAHDMDDTIVLFEEGKKIASSWKNSTFIATQGLGHSMHDADLYSEIIRFLMENPAT